MNAKNETILWMDLTNSGDGTPMSDVIQRFVVYQTPYTQKIDSTIHDLKPCAACLELDSDHPSSNELATLILIRNTYPALPVVIISAQYSLVLAMYARREKVQGYIVKQYSDSIADTLDEVIARAKTTARQAAIRRKPSSVQSDMSG